MLSHFFWRADFPQLAFFPVFAPQHNTCKNHLRLSWIRPIARNRRQISANRGLWSFLVKTEHSVSEGGSWIIESFRKHDANDNENVIWKFNFAFPQSFLNYSKSLCLQDVFWKILKLNWNQRLRSRDKTIKLNICHHMFTLSTQLQNRSFHVVERMRTSAKFHKMKTARPKRAKLFFYVQYVNLWRFCCTVFVVG